MRAIDRVKRYFVTTTDDGRTVVTTTPDERNLLKDHLKKAVRPGYSPPPGSNASPSLSPEPESKPNTIKRLAPQSYSYSDSQEERVKLRLERRKPCGMCLQEFAVSCLPYLISSKAISEQRALWGVDQLKARDIIPSQMYNRIAICTFCAQFFGMDRSSLEASTDFDDCRYLRKNVASRVRAYRRAYFDSLKREEEQEERTRQGREAYEESQRRGPQLELEAASMRSNSSRPPTHPNSNLAEDIAQDGEGGKRLWSPHNVSGMSRSAFELHDDEEDVEEEQLRQEPVTEEPSSITNESRSKPRLSEHRLRTLGTHNRSVELRRQKSQEQRRANERATSAQNVYPPHPSMRKGKLATSGGRAEQLDWSPPPSLESTLHGLSSKMRHSTLALMKARRQREESKPAIDMSSLALLRVGTGGGGGLRTSSSSDSYSR